MTTAVLWSLSSTTALAFTDTQTHWANACIDQLAQREQVTGYPDGGFRPQSTVTRAEFAVLMLNAFPNIQPARRAASFNDVPASHWAYRAIREAYVRQFFSGYPDGSFKPNQPIPRAQAIAILANAANLSSSEPPETVLQRYFDDAQQVPAYARPAIAAGTVGRIVVNHPNLRQLRPNQAVTRGEVAALLCQSLNLARTVPAEYIAGDRSFVLAPEMGGASPFSEGLATVLVNGKYGFMNAQGAIVIPAEFENAMPFSEGLAAVQIGGLWGFINREGRSVIPAQFSQMPGSFSDGLARISTETGTAFINKTAEIVIEPQRHTISDFSDGRAMIIVNGKVGFIDTTGAVVIEPQFDQARNFSEGLAPVRVDHSGSGGRWGYIDRDGQVAIEPQFGEVQPFSEGLAGIFIDHGGDSYRWGYIDRSGQVVIGPQFYASDEFNGDIVTPFAGGVAMARQGERAGFIDRTGRWTIAPQYVDAQPVSEGLARVNVGGTWVREEIGCTHSDGCFFSRSVRGGKWGYIRVTNSSQ